MSDDPTDSVTALKDSG